MFTLNHGFKGYSLRRHLGDPPFSYQVSAPDRWHQIIMDLQPNFAVQRQAIRQQVRQQRRLLTPAQQESFALQAAKQVMAHPRIQAAQHIAVFLSFDGELDTQPLIDQLWRQHKSLYLPVLHPFSAGHLLFLAYQPDTKLVVNRLKIREPQLDVRQVLPLEKLDVILTPLVAFDSQGERLGMGGGFYDRTLQDWQQGGAYPIGLAHDCQQVAQIPTEVWDIPLPQIITPSGYWPR